MLDLRAGGMMHYGPWLELLGFCLPLGHFNGVQWKWLQSFAPPISSGGGWRRIPSLFGMPIVLVVAVSAHNLVPRDGIMSRLSFQRSRRFFPNWSISKIENTVDRSIKHCISFTWKWTHRRYERVKVKQAFHSVVMWLLIQQPPRQKKILQEIKYEKIKHFFTAAII